MKYTLLLSALTLTLTACAGLPPSSHDVAQAPRIEIGQPIPAGDNYVLHYPAGKSLPVTTQVDGNLFEQAQQATLHVVLKHDVYVFRHFASFDGINWQPAHKLVTSNLELQIPAKEGGNAGLLHIKMDQK